MFLYFADNLKMSMQFNKLGYYSKLQNDLDKFVEWVNLWAPR